MLVRAELFTNELIDDGGGYPVPADSRLVDVEVTQLTQEAVEAALSPIIDLSSWTLASAWQPANESFFEVF